MPFLRPEKRGTATVYFRKMVAVPLFLLILCLACSEAALKDIAVFDADMEKARFKAETAATPWQRARGLMFREHLPRDSGMLFIFEKDRRQSFWMMNTSIPLDIIFIDSSRKVINIEEAEPCGLFGCPAYHSKRPCRYVLEINQGLSRELEIHPGSRVAFD